MRYQHVPTTIDQQIELLRTRGMVGNQELMRRWLETVGYYRLSAYWLPYELLPPAGQTRSKEFPPSTNFSDIVDIYVFDRKLRLLVMEAIDRFEIAVRSRWTNRLSMAHGSHAHMDYRNFTDGYEHAKMYAKIVQTASQSREVFIEHYRTKYTEPFLPPLWQITELMTLGEISMWVKATKDNRIKDAIARDIGLPNKETLEGTLQLLSYIRNICAHHSRLWNRRTVKRVHNIRNFRPDIDIEHTSGQHQPRNSIYNVLVVLARTLKHQSPDTTYPQRVANLISTRSRAQQRAMGFPDNWKSRPIWQMPSRQTLNSISQFTRWVRRRFGS